ncbi:MAG: hypothetical protein WBA41_25740 [Rivularia sp. (in: cyanobacteria)]
MDITTLVPEFEQYTLVQKKLFLDWIELPIENDEDEEARQRFLNSLNNPNDSNSEGELNEIEINEKFDLLIQRIQIQETTPSKTFLASTFIDGGKIIDDVGNNISEEKLCEAKCIKVRDKTKNKECVSNCLKKK